MRITPLLILILLNVQALYAQYENIWAFGDSAGIDFNGAPAAAMTTAIQGGERTASVCDENGSLLFYTSGDQVWDKNHQLMPNGDTLITDPAMPGTGRYCVSSSQSSIIIPMPGQPDKYYLFSLTALELGRLSGRLYYSVIDMTLNNGLGDVDVSNKGILLDSNLTEHISGAVGGRCNLWLIVVSSAFSPQGAQFKSYEITEQGIQRTPVVSTSPAITTAGLPLGKIDVSPSGEKVAICRRDPWGNAGYGVEIYDFDRSTGQLSNLLLLSEHSTVSDEAYYGVTFSPDNSKIYVSQDSMFQFDLSSNNIATMVSSKTFIDMAHDVKRAPDGKVYYTSRNGNNLEIGVIKYPDLPGTSCQAVPNSLAPLPGTRFAGFPNLVPVVRKDTFLNSQQVSAGCFAVQTTISANGSEGWDYVWGTGQTGSQLTVDTPGTYWVTYFTPPCNYHVDSFHVAFPAGILPTLNIQAECRDDSNGQVYAGTYAGDPVLYTYTWLQGSDTLFTGDSLQNVPSGAYRVHVQTSTGCDTLLHVEIPEEDFRVSFSVSDTLICLGDKISFKNASDTHFTIFHWDLANGDVSSLFEPTPHLFAQSGAYQVVLSGAGAICRDTARLKIQVDQPVIPGYYAEPDAVCLGQSVYFFSTTDSTTVSLEWMLDDQVREEAFVESVFQHAFDEPGIFPVSLNMQFRACPDTSHTDSITVYPLPEMDLGSDSSICFQGGPVYLKNLRALPDGALNYLWSTGDTTPILKVVHAGTYSLSVRSGPIGCTTTESIEISKDCYIDIPNAFTPNGDGYNDYFFPRQLLSEGVTAFSMQVFNRWGRVVFETANPNGRGWDGRFNDKVQPVGVYVYRIEINFVDGHGEKYEGNVTLLR